CWPYIALLASVSSRSVPPSSASPPNAPFDRDHDKTSACIEASVSAVASRPTGPAATEASAPRVNLLDRIPFIPFSLITSMTISTASPPTWRPNPPPSTFIAAGALHPPPDFLQEA